MEEEFNNFMHKVTEIHGIVSKLTSNDKELNNIGVLEADQYLNDTKEKHFDGEDSYEVNYNKSIINKVVERNTDEMSKDAFMKEIEKDAEKRYQDKKSRKESSDTLKIQGNKAFRRQEYEKALTLYTKAIQFTNDSCVLYTNRAVTYINLNLLDKSIQDCTTALKLNENSLKGWMLLIKSYFLKGNKQEMQNSIKECLDTNPEYEKDINEFVQNLQEQ